MKKLKKLTAIILLGLLIFSSIDVKGQDPSFSQPMNNPLLLNPSLMGMDNSMRAILNYRNQWNGLDKGFNTASFSFIMPIFLNDGEWLQGNGRKRLDVGVNTTADIAGAFTRLNASASIGYGLFVSEKSFLHASLNIGYLQNSLDASGLIFDDQYQWGAYDASSTTGESFANTSVNAIDVGFGFLWRYMNEDSNLNAFAGLSAYHLNQPDISFHSEKEALPSRFSLQAGLTIKGEDDLNFHPTAIYTSQGSYDLFMTGLLADYKNIMLGCWYKSGESIVLQTGYDHESFLFSYSYDFGNSVVSRNIHGIMTHEISLAYKFKAKY